MAKVDFSIISPIKNESLSLSQLILEITRTFKAKNYEIIMVNDASNDNTAQVLKTLTRKLSQIKIINLKSHQGKWAALSAGFKASKGQIIITLDSDLQDNPFEVNKLLNKLTQGYDLVSGWRKIRFDPLYKVLISRLGNLLASSLTGHKFRDLNSPFKVYKRPVLENLPNTGSMLRFTMLFAQKLGYKISEIPISHRPRIYGKSKFGLVKYIRILYDLILILLLFSGSGRIKKL